MIRIPVPDEIKRLRSLRDLVILDSEPEPFFDSLAKLASEACGAPIALMSLVDEHRQWFKANVGLPSFNETAREVAFCSHAIMAQELFVVADASADPRFESNPMVLGDPAIRFYAGAPLTTSDGERVGTLCVMDRIERKLTEEQLSMLSKLAEIASQGLEMRRDLITKAIGQRTDYERKLSLSESVHRALIESQSEMVSLATEDGTLVYASPAYARSLDSDPDGMLGCNLLDHAGPDEADAVSAMVSAVFDTSQSMQSENRMSAPGGSERWVAWTNSIYEEPGGRRLLHSVGRDITERRQAEAELLASKRMLTRTGRLAGVGGWEYDIAKRSLSWSDQTRMIHEADQGFAPTIDNIFEFFGPEPKELISAAMKAALTQGSPWELDLPMTTAKGREIWIRSMGEAELAPDGLPKLIVGAICDITSSKLLSIKIDENERFIRHVVDKLPMGIAYIGPDLKFKFANSEQCARFGLPREKIIGRTREQITGLPLSPDASATIGSALRGQSHRYESEEAINGELRLLERQLIPDISKDGEVLGLYGVAFDVTERAKNEKRLLDLIAILENTPDFVAQTDWAGAVTYMNPAARAFCGLSNDASLQGRMFSDFHAPQTQAQFIKEAIPMAKQTGTWSGEACVRGAGGREALVSHLIIAHKGASGRIERYSAIMRDISEQAQARKAILAQSETLGAVIEAIPALVAVVGSDGRVRLVNRAYERWTQVERQEAIGMPVLDSLRHRDPEGARAWIELALQSQTGSYQRIVQTALGERHMAGAYLPLSTPSGAKDGFVIVAQDVTEHKLEEVRLLQLARRDSLTGLLNRSGFADEAERLIKEGHGPKLALLCIDLDRFKPVNDTHGHPAGDELLRTFAHRLERLVRPTDFVARLGGDEFAILLTGVDDPSGGATVADKVVAAAAEPFEVRGMKLSIGASVGIAHHADQEGGWIEFLAKADAKLYEAKGAGRGRRA